MAYPETKVYSDGNHFIAIPHTEKPYRKRYVPPEEVITVTEPENGQTAPQNNESNVAPDETVTQNMSEKAEEITQNNSESSVENKSPPKPVKSVTMTKKELFNNLYAESLNMSKSARKAFILERMRPFFKDAESAEVYVTNGIERKQRNLISRRIRLVRKVNLQTWNYFVTFTYNDALHTEDSFKKKLRTTLSHLCDRKGWKYLGVWERSPEKKRLHFHGIFYIPEGTMPGKMEEQESYSFTDRKRQITYQNDYFNYRFGRNDFRFIEDKGHIGDAVAYIMKYIEKSGEKIVYSRGLPQYFISDIMDEDVICNIGLEEKKLLLFDDFTCWDEGCLVGQVSEETIAQMRKSN